MKWNARRSIDDARRYVAYAVRSLARQPAFTAAVVLTLSVGVGATTTIYSVVRTVLFQPLPLTDADRVVRIVENDRPRSLPQVNYREYLEWQPRVTTLSGVAALAENSDVLMRAPAGLVKVNAAFVSANYFELLGARPRLGRALLAGDAESDVMVLGYSAWQRHFASDAQVIGSVISFQSSPLAGRALTVVGVMPESMETLNPLIDFYLPIATTPNAGTMTLARMLGRLRDGVSASAASEEANAIGMAIRPPRPASAPPLTSARFEVRSLEDGLFDPRPGSQVPANLATIRTVLRFFLAAVVVVLLIVCANVVAPFACERDRSPSRAGNTARAWSEPMAVAARDARRMRRPRGCGRRGRRGAWRRRSLRDQVAGDAGHARDVPDRLRHEHSAARQ